jgi:hypothetical protein
MPQDHRPPGLNFTVEEWSAAGLTYETLAICRTLAMARRVRGCARGKACRSVHVPQPNPRCSAVQRHQEGHWRSQ